MIAEEQEICKKASSNQLNMQLIQQLETVLRDYQAQMNVVSSRLWDGNLSAINDRIKTINEHPLICEQIAAVKQHQKRTTNSYEHTC